MEREAALALIVVGAAVALLLHALAGAALIVAGLVGLRAANRAGNHPRPPLGGPSEPGGGP